MFLYVGKTFDTAWIEGLLYKLTILNLPSHLVHVISSDVRGVFPDGHIIPSRHAGWGGALWVDLPCPLQSMSRHTHTIAPHRASPLRGQHGHHITSRKPTMLVSYLDTHLSNLQRWLMEWRIAINVSKNSAIIFARAGRRFIQPRSVTLFEEPIKLVDTTHYLGVTLDKRLTWSPHIDRLRRTAQRMASLVSIPRHQPTKAINYPPLYYV